MKPSHDNLPERRIDPLRRVFVPREDAMGRFRTHDGEAYRRDSAGTIHRAQPKGPREGRAEG